MSKRTKFVFVTGGVVSSIGKGLGAASIGALMEARGLRVTHSSTKCSLPRAIRFGESSR